MNAGNNAWGRRRQGHGYNHPNNNNHKQQRATSIVIPWVARLFQKHSWLWFPSTVAMLAAWYATPVSEWIVELALHEIPVAEDIELGRQAVAAQQQQQRHSIQSSYDAQWSPQIERIGNDLVQTLLLLPNYYLESDDEDAKKSTKHHNSNNRGYHLHHPKELSLYEWDFGIVRSADINAFCLPGGVIRVTSALLQMLQPSTGELAGLLGHEMGHVIQRHAQKRILSKQMLQYAISTILDLNSDQGGGGTNYRGYQNQPRGRRSGSSSSLGRHLGQLLLGTTDWFGQQHFSRRDEYQADAVAWDLLLASRHYNPQSLTSLLTKLWSLEQDHSSSRAWQQQQQQQQGNKSPKLPHAAAALDQITAWSRTHPATKDRIQTLEQKWQALPATKRRRLARHAI